MYFHCNEKSISIAMRIVFQLQWEMYFHCNDKCISIAMEMYLNCYGNVFQLQWKTYLIAMRNVFQLQWETYFIVVGNVFQLQRKLLHFEASSETKLGRREADKLITRGELLSSDVTRSFFLFFSSLWHFIAISYVLFFLFLLCGIYLRYISF